MIILLLQILSLVVTSVLGLGLAWHVVSIPFQKKLHYPVMNVLFKLIGVGVLLTVAIWLPFFYGWVK